MTKEQQYIDHVKSCFEKAERGESKLPQEILDMEGMTGTKTRHLYNNLLEMECARYLEIGVWQGSSSCAAMYGNKADITLIDDFSGFGGPREKFIVNYEKYVGDNFAVFLEKDCFKIDLSNWNKRFNIFLADADHSFESQRKIIEYYAPVMEDVFILIVDDYNWEEVRKGTAQGIVDSNLLVVWEHIVRTTDDNSFPDQEVAKNGFWNGIAVFILKKA